ncbi:hypothetical protein BH11CYA1_BH11CYA1_51110 [soil metagenome]
MFRLKNILSLDKTMPLVVLALIEFFCFFPAMRRVGFYLDDWATMAYLHFAPKDQGIFEFFKYYLLHDSRVQNRPIEVIHFGLIHWLFGSQPFAFHFVNVFMEVLAAYLAYKIFLRISSSRAISILSAIFFILHPAHDSSHYWVICSSVTLSLCLYLGSLLTILQFSNDFEQKGKGKRLIVLAATSSLCFLLSLLNYETLLPLAAVNVLLVFVSRFTAQSEKSAGRLAQASKAAGLVAFFMALPVVALLCYLKLVMPLVGVGYVHGVVFDLGTMLKIVGRGLELNMPITLFGFAVQQSANTLAAVTIGDWLHLAAIAIVTFCAVVLFCRRDQGDESTALQGPRKNYRGWYLMLVGFIGVIASYSIFGLNAEYEPTYYTIVNRINMGGSFSSAIFLLGFLRLVSDCIPSRVQAVWPYLLALFASVIASTFSLANFALAKPWVASWVTQTAIRKNVLSHAVELGKAPTLLLVNCPRYVLWSPVFDGVWDFSNMLRIALDDSNVNANVISERLTIDDTAVTDISRGFKCGQYPFEKLFLFVAPGGPLVRAANAKAFIETVERKGMGFGLAPDAIAKWKREAHITLY